MRKSLLEIFETCLEGLAYRDRVKFYDAIADMHTAIQFWNVSEPAFAELLSAIESTEIPDPAAQTEYDSTRLTEIVERRAAQFRRHWSSDWGSVLAENLAEEFRLTVEEATGEPRQQPIKR